MLVFRASWNWDEIDETAFARLVRNYGGVGRAELRGGLSRRDTFSLLFLTRRQTGKIEIKGLCTAGAVAERLVDEHLSAISEGVAAKCARAVETTSWLGFALNPFPELFKANPGDALAKVKDAFFRKPLTDRQIQTAYNYLTRTGLRHPWRNPRSRHLWRTGEHRRFRCAGVRRSGIRY